MKNAIIFAWGIFLQGVLSAVPGCTSGARGYERPELDPRYEASEEDRLTDQEMERWIFHAKNVALRAEPKLKLLPEESEFPDINLSVATY